MYLLPSVIQEQVIAGLPTRLSITLLCIGLDVGALTLKTNRSDELIVIALFRISLWIQITLYNYALQAITCQENIVTLFHLLASPLFSYSQHQSVTLKIAF